MEPQWANLVETFDHLGNRTGEWWIVSPFLTAMPLIDELSGVRVLIRGEIADFLKGL